MYSDPIADMITRIRNAYMVKKQSVVVPHSHTKEAIARVLKAQQYIVDYQTSQQDAKKDLIMQLRYVKRYPAIKHIARVSKAGRRLYTSKQELPFILSKLGKAIISTSHGIMTTDQARAKGIGGEVMIELW